MNIDRIVRRIKRDIGIYGMALPIDNVDKLIGEILVDTTLPVFSMYQPAEEWYPLDGLRRNQRKIWVIYTFFQIFLEENYCM